MSDSTSSIPPEEGASFLSRDFTQCFAQLRHYDSQIWAICRFAFTAYVAIVGAVIGLYQYSIDRSIDLIPVAMCILSIGIALGFMIYGLIIRNRVYYVFVCRYINEHRGFFLNTQPLGFTNSSGMYVNSRQPPYFNWRSWQSFLAYITALLNAGLTALLVLYALARISHTGKPEASEGRVEAVTSVVNGVGAKKSPRRVFSGRLATRSTG